MNTDDNYHDIVKEMLIDLDMSIESEDTSKSMFIVSNEDKNIYGLIVICEPPILIIELYIVDAEKMDHRYFVRLLEMNRMLVHGAFTLEESTKKVFYRDTLQLENLDFNEFEGTINAIELGLIEFGEELVGK